MPRRFLNGRNAIQAVTVLVGTGVVAGFIQGIGFELLDAGFAGITVGGFLVAHALVWVGDWFADMAKLPK